MKYNRDENAKNELGVAFKDKLRNEKVGRRSNS